MTPEATPADALDAVTRFFDRMRAFDWDSMAACLADDVVRVGPYRDIKNGRDEYRDFLAETIEAIDDYRQDVQRIWADGARAVAQLSETMNVDGRPRRTDEAIVLDLGPDGLIHRVEVYLQRSYFVGDEPDIVRNTKSIGAPAGADLEDRENAWR
ncbi:MAG TPA: nuclear transport factor 2 family protein [Acidimicrobiia bacterium]|nr:nuclear transport factor 2 family protein [Acidimicrobiia bacterium]